MIYRWRSGVRYLQKEPQDVCVASGVTAVDDPFGCPLPFQCCTTTLLRAAFYIRALFELCWMVKGGFSFATIDALSVMSARDIE